MIVVLPVCASDYAIAIRNVEHAIMLDGSVEFDAIIAHDRHFDVTVLKEKCDHYFNSVTQIICEPWTGDRSWPKPANFAWQHVARVAIGFKKPWFWWEADATPLRAGWLTYLAYAHKTGNRSFSGAVTSQNGLTYMAGVAIYPPNTAHRCEHAMFAREAAFDIVASTKDGILRHTHDISSLIAHTPTINNTRFKDEQDVKRLIPEGSVLFHKCKDGSLLDVLQGKTPSAEAEDAANDNVPSFTEQTQWPSGYFAFPTHGNTAHFNCSIAQVKGETFLFTRRWRYNMEKVKGKQSSANKSDLAIFKVRKNMSLEPNVIIPSVPSRYQNEQWEDPRVMVGKDGRLYMSFATWVHYKNWSIRQSFARLSHDWRAVEPLFEPPYGGNTRVPTNGRQHEKNWIWFEHGGKWVCQYSINPGVFFSVDGKGNVIDEWKSPELELPWKHGLPLRGGTPLTRVGDELIGFFHTAVPWRKPQRRYYMGAYALMAEPPFTLKRMTDDPLLIGSEHDFRALNGPLVIFPNGALLRDNEWLVVFGVNDESCGWIKIPHNDIDAWMVKV